MSNKRNSFRDNPGKEQTSVLKDIREEIKDGNNDRREARSLELISPRGRQQGVGRSSSDDRNIFARYNKGHDNFMAPFRDISGTLKRVVDALKLVAGPAESLAFGDKVNYNQKIEMVHDKTANQVQSLAQNLAAQGYNASQEEMSHWYAQLQVINTNVYNQSREAALVTQHGGIAQGVLGQVGLVDRENQIKRMTQAQETALDLNFGIRHKLEYQEEVRKEARRRANAQEATSKGLVGSAKQRDMNAAVEKNAQHNDGSY